MDKVQKTIGSQYRSIVIIYENVGDTNPSLHYMFVYIIKMQITIN
jgi:hypothetical protein